MGDGMAKSDSGRIVLEIDPGLKKALYSVLAHEQQTLKDWFMNKANEHIEEKKSEIIKSFLKANNEI
ncbi:hypothetical protein [Pseudomonas brassicacearum]|uniref:hypothetical protein n=1 Tax=Pseudomonas brassicacearum TaxID=930166 RepID=UPI0021825563|nr:hypothetical protein [Pseudomonas brassicacearum]